MSKFAESTKSLAFCFLTSANKDLIIAPNPTTTRGNSTTITAHPREPRVIYPSGKYIIIRNLEDPTDSFVYRGHSHITTVAKFSPNGFWVASGDVSGKVKIWAWDNPEHILKIEVAVFSGEVKDLDWDFESKRIVAVGNGSESYAKVFVWDQGTTLGEVSGHYKCILAAAFKPTRPMRIMTGSEDTRTLFFTGPPFKMDHSNATHTNYVNCVRYSPSGAIVASVGSDKKIQLYDGTSGQPTQAVENAHEGSIYSIAWSPDSTKFITSSADKTVKLWDAATLQCVKVFTFSADPQLADMQVSTLWTSTHMISVSLSGNMNYLDPENPTQPRRIVQAHQVSITSAMFDRPSSTLYTGSYDGVVCAYAVTDKVSRRVQGADKKSIPGAVHGGKVTGLALIQGTLLTVGWDDCLRVSDVASLSATDSTALNGQPCAVAASFELGLVVVATNKELVLFRGNSKLFSLEGLPYGATCVDIINDEEVAVGGDDFKTHVYSVVGLTAFKEVTTISTRSAVSVVKYSPLADAIAIGDSGRQIDVYERVSWAARITEQWCAHSSKVTCLSWSPSAQMLASGAQDEVIYVWRFSTPTVQLRIPFTHMGGVTGVDWIDENRLISTGNDHCIVVWKDVGRF